ncbi:uncharacterized protein [Primulina huaijiensis]|uniref:uncharacterized protein n=1 Tax=Primulina huaijiensis TaxID=1492673 RepID=UPI003CC7395F
MSNQEEIPLNSFILRKSHNPSLVIGNPATPLRTRRQMINEYMHAAFISQDEPKKIEETLLDPSWIEAMQEELNQFKRNEVWFLVPRPSHQAVIGTRWVFRNKLNDEGTVIRNKSTIGGPSLVDDLIGVEAALPHWSGSSHTKLDKDKSGIPVEVTQYRGLIGSLLYLTVSRLDILFAVCICARFQSNPKQSHYIAGKRILKYLKRTQNIGLWYPNDSSFNLIGYSDTDYVGCKLDRKSTNGFCQFLGDRLISWFSKKQTSIATSTVEAEYLAAGSCCSQILRCNNNLKTMEFKLLIHLSSVQYQCHYNHAKSSTSFQNKAHRHQTSFY